MRDAFPYIALPRGTTLPWLKSSEGFYRDTVAIVPTSLNLTGSSVPYTESFLKEKTQSPYLLLAGKDHWHQLQELNSQNCSRYDKEFIPNWKGVPWRREDGIRPETGWV